MDPYGNAANQYGQEMQFGVRLQDALNQRQAEMPNQLFDRFMQSYQAQIKQRMLEQQMARQQQHEDTYLQMAKDREARDRASQINATADDIYNQYGGDPGQREMFKSRLVAQGVSPERAEAMLPRDTTVVPDQGQKIGNIGGQDITLPETAADIQTIPGVGGGLKLKQTAAKLQADREARQAAAEQAKEERLWAALGQSGDLRNTMMAETARHNQEMERLGQQRVNVTIANGQPQGALGQDALDIMANTFLKTGQIPITFRGKEGENVKRQILNRAAEISGGSVRDVAGVAADFKANQASQIQMQKSYDAIVAFENTGMKNIDLMIQSAKKLTDTGSPLLNRPIRDLQSGLFGNENVNVAKAARTVANNEIAKITTNPNLTGVLTDEAMKEVAKYNPDNATLGQTIAVANLLKRDMENRKISMEDQLKAIRGRISGGAPSESGAPKVGEIRKGYRFKGGDPSNKANWEKVQ